jgi:hypothetical protein
MEKKAVLRLGANQKELRQFLPDACLHVSRIAERNFPRTQETHAGKILFQFQKDRACPIQSTGRSEQSGA